MNDLISRATAIEALHTEIMKRRLSEDTNDDGLLDEFDTESVLRRLPSAQQWIPCSERLPKTEEKVFVTCEHLDIYGKPHRYVCKAYHVDRYTVRADFDYWDEGCDEYREEDDQFYVLEGWYEYIHNWGDYSSVRITEDKVVAWMPLSEPWKGENDE